MWWQWEDPWDIWKVGSVGDKFDGEWDTMEAEMITSSLTWATDGIVVPRRNGTLAEE